MPLLWMEEVPASTSSPAPRTVGIPRAVGHDDRAESPFSEASHPGSLIGSPAVLSSDVSFEEALRPVSPVRAQPSSPEHTETSRPGYHPRTIPVHTERSIYDRMHADPRLFFLGAPSAYQEQFPSSIVRRVRHEAIGNRLVPVVTWQPSGVSSIQRTERVEIEGPAGMTTIYTLSSVWSFDRTYGVQRSIRTQTPRRWGPTSTAVSASSTSTSDSTGGGDDNSSASDSASSSVGTSVSTSDAATSMEVETAEVAIQVPPPISE